MRRSGFRNSAAISRLKALLSVVETFVRSNSASLEKTNSGATWNDVRGAWAIASNAASTSTAGSSYPISTLTFTQEDVTISVGGIGPGMGTAFWVTDSNNWWGAYVDVVQTCSTCETPGNVATYAYAYVSGGNCATYSTVPGNCSTYSTVPGNCSTYSTVPGNCSTWSTVDANCATYSTVPGNCSTWSTSCSYPCNATTPTTYPCNAYNKSYPCNATNPTNYPCNANYPTNYPCNATNPATYPCNVYNPITYSTIATSYNAATYYTCNCVNNYKINIVKMIAGTLTNVATFSFASAIASFKAILSGSTITVQAFTGSNWTTQIGSNQSTTLSGYTKTKKHGILKGVVTYSPVETSTIDEFRVG